MGAKVGIFLFIAKYVIRSFCFLYEKKVENIKLPLFLRSCKAFAAPKVKLEF
jgi:hypothetical protein